MSKYVSGEGPLGAKIAIVGEAPGATEDQLGRPFVGSSGNLLDSCLSTVGINRHECYITNVVKMRPPRNDFGTLYRDSKRTQPTEKLIKWREDLIKELKRVNPNIIVCLGDEALRALTNRSGITKWRGSLMESPAGKLIASFHPAYVMRVYQHRVILQADLKRAKEESVTKELKLPKYTLALNPTFRTVKDFLNYLLEWKPRITFDIESNGKFIRCLGIGTGPHEAFVIPFTSDPHFRRASQIRIETASEISMASHWSLEEEYEILSLLNKVFLDPEILCCAQNFPFDSSILARQFGFHIRGIWIDTMVAHHALYSELPKKLDFLVSIYTRSPRYSDYNPADDHDLWRYNAMDAATTYEVAQRLEEELVQEDLWDFYKDHAEPVMLALTRMQNRGVHVDKPYMEKMKADFQEKAEKALSEAQEEIGQEFNPKSPKQMKEILYEKLNLPKQYKGRGKNRTVTVDVKALETLAEKYTKHEKFLNNVISYRRSKDAISKVLNVRLTPEGLLTTSWNATGTVTRRLSSSANIFDEGMNLQNIHKGPMRAMIVAEDGKVLVKCDLSQAEARFVAWDAGIKVLVDRFLHDDDFDIHRWCASYVVFEISEDEVTKTQRSLAKVAVHGGNYHIGPSAASKTYGISFSAAKDILRRYSSVVGKEGLADWWKEIEQAVISERKLTNPHGARRIFLGRLDDSTFREAYAQKPQCHVADAIINRAVLLGEVLLEHLESYPILQIHDEVVFEVSEKHPTEALKIIYNIMQPSFKIGDKIKEPLVIPTEAKIGHNWYEMKPKEQYFGETVE